MRVNRGVNVDEEENVRLQREKGMERIGYREREIG